MTQPTPPAARTLDLDWTVDAAHPAFDGHFPDRPILPGVAILAQVLEAAARHLDPRWVVQPSTLGSAKFLLPLGPSSVCRMRLSADTSAAGRRRLRFELSLGGRSAAVGSFEQDEA